MPADHAVATLPHTLDGLNIPLKILQRRIGNSGTSVVPQVLILWSGLPRSLATWEDEATLKQRFPRAPAWGQAVSSPAGDVSSAGEGGQPSCSKEDGDTEDGPRRSTRTPRPSTKYTGPAWLNGLDTPCNRT